MLPAASEALLHHATTRGNGSRMAGAESATVERDHLHRKPVYPLRTGYATHDILNTEVTTIDGEKTTLASFAGKVLLIVNVASKCGLTPPV